MLCRFEGDRGTGRTAAALLIEGVKFAKRGSTTGQKHYRRPLSSYLTQAPMLSGAHTLCCPFLQMPRQTDTKANSLQRRLDAYLGIAHNSKLYFECPTAPLSAACASEKTPSDSFTPPLPPPPNAEFRWCRQLDLLPTFCGKHLGTRYKGPVPYSQWMRSAVCAGAAASLSPFHPSSRQLVYATVRAYTYRICTHDPLSRNQSQQKGRLREIPLQPSLHPRFIQPSKQRWRSPPPRRIARQLRQPSQKLPTPPPPRRPTRQLRQPSESRPTTPPPRR